MTHGAEGGVVNIVPPEIKDRSHIWPKQQRKSIIRLSAWPFCYRNHTRANFPGTKVPPKINPNESREDSLIYNGPLRCTEQNAIIMNSLIVSCVHFPIVITHYQLYVIKSKHHLRPTCLRDKYQNQTL
ncbi:hypothetical protein I7I50_07535 [Histoplasma capsulatum G186AR]|uniref:Uncharacterized protein n=1 Tax=Ajellomyces capsulatus TaxID=5037 RepID=A0A8H8D473_AJECA|nr:hypothetical protein I7I52_09394 [Histoplasma capsulatum]QSS68203.1 hypothetical protein I7I50_07535 [Histoplasma capsulatum G186AR]